MRSRSGKEEEHMKNEIEKRRGGDVLYESVEPLFPEDFGVRRLRIRRFILLALFICVAVCALIVGASGIAGVREDESDSDSITGDGETLTEDESVSIPMGGINESEEEGVSEEGVDVTEEPTGYEEESVSEFLTEDESETVTDSELSVVGVDLSQIEKGEGYVINYSDSDADIVGLLDRGFIGREEAGASAPLFLIIHTHTSEAYLDGGSGYRGPKSVVSVGDVLTSRLNTLGVGAVHCTVIHDKSGNAYENAAATVRTMLEIYPSIKYILDIHRLVLGSDGASIKSVSGCADNSAQVRLTVGARDSDAEWQEDLSLALSLRGALNRGGRVCMPVVISSSIPNSGLGKYYLTVDVGTSVNTVEEAMAAARRLASAIAETVLD